jgi:simple sugar transport system ATP-binding protein
LSGEVRMPENSEKFLEVKNISKSYVGVQALDKVNLSINKGEISCLVGENGSGKSTLIKIIAGVTRADEGEIIIEGKKYKHIHAIDAIRQGIQVIYQDLSLFPNMSIAENISLNQMIERKRKAISWKEVREIAEKEISNINKDLDLDEKVENISIANKQLVAICRALTHNAKLIIMDEPTTAIAQKEIDFLFSVISDLKKRGISTLFVSHKLSEVLRISEKVTVIRDGKLVGVYNTKELNHDTLSFYMSGKKLSDSVFEYKEKKKQKKPLLEVKNLSKKGNFQNINFQIKSGEIVGITGIIGSGRTELALSLFGLNKADTGQIYIDGKQVKIRFPQDAIEHGLSYLPEDRLNQGLFIKQPIGNNIVVTILKKLLNKLNLIENNKKYKYAEKWSEDLNIVAPSLDTAVQALSGGNQQRVVTAKWLATHPKVFILDGPTVGIDVASKSNIHNIIRKLANQGMGVIIISDEIPEILRNCNRLIVISEGKIFKKLNTNEVTENQLLDILAKKNN